ncbi:BRO-N domain-containing protein [Salmonella enterica]|uniref:BRO-N domain-containing protein n=1 Tax=Salmonella enterica TaxID=28901 RepID=UPI0009ADE195|nr:BRO family protein [Salmonella enterica]
MATQLTFKSHVLETVEHNGKIWFRSASLAKALEYSDPRSVNKIYERNSDEFTPCMVTVVEGVNLTSSDKSKGYGNLVTKNRLFSLRGAHLIAMFASTKVAKEFRRWLLDLIEEEANRQQSQQPVPTGTPIQLPRGIYCYPNNRNPYQAYVRLEGKKTFVGSFRTIKEATDAQAGFIEKAARKTSLTAVPELVPGRYRCIVRPDGQMQFSSIEDKTLIDATAIRRLRSDMRYAMTVVMELHNRLRIVDGEESASRLDTPLSNITF